MLLLLLILLGISTQSFAETISANDSRVLYVGRTEALADGSVTWDWTGTIIRVHWIGDTLSVRASDTRRNRYNLYWDRPFSAEPDAVVETKGDSTLLLYAGSVGEHTLTMVKRTEAEQGRTTFHSFTCHGSFLPAQARSLLLEFIGDSYSCGYGADGCDSTSRFTMETESVSKAFPMLIADSLKADALVIAHSGMGVIRNYNSKFPRWTMPLRYQHTFDMDSTASTIWNAHQSMLHPAMTIVFLGSNDFSRKVIPDSAAFVQGYQSLLSQIKTNYGSHHPILCVAKCVNKPLTRYVQSAVQSCGMSDIYFTALDYAYYMPNATYWGADAHPNEKAHQLIADTLLPIISSILDR